MAPARVTASPGRPGVAPALAAVRAAGDLVVALDRIQRRLRRPTCTGVMNGHDDTPDQPAGTTSQPASGRRGAVRAPHLRAASAARGRLPGARVVTGSGPGRRSPDDVRPPRRTAPASRSRRRPRRSPPVSVATDRRRRRRHSVLCAVIVSAATVGVSSARRLGSPAAATAAERDQRDRHDGPSSSGSTTPVTIIRTRPSSMWRPTLKPGRGDHHDRIGRLGPRFGPGSMPSTGIGSGFIFDASGLTSRTTTSSRAAPPLQPSLPGRGGDPRHGRRRRSDPDLAVVKVDKTACRPRDRQFLASRSASSWSPSAARSGPSPRP